MSIIITILATVFVLGILIFVHELGHFLVAKLFGVRVEAFSLGFPPQLVHKKIGDTDYRLSVVPLGGYVKMLGENPGEEIPPELQPFSFMHQPLWHRFLIVLAGPISNLILAFLVFLLVFAVNGIPYLTTVITEVEQNSPAAAAGLQPGDQVLELNGRPVKRWEDLPPIIRQAGEHPLDLTLKRGQKIITVKVTPHREEVPNIFGGKSSAVIIGILNNKNLAIDNVGLGRAFVRAGDATWGVCYLTTLSLYKVLTGEAPLKGLGGPILIAQVAGQEAKAGAAPLLQFLATLSVNLFLLNLLPIPILDGGHLLFCALEAVRRKPVEIQLREIAQGVGLMLILALMILVFYQDIARLVNPPH
ncbi:MAG: RIP metalloprotease RseP [Desulfobaccales bacterium]